MKKRSGYHVFLAVPTRGSIHYITVTRLEEVRDNTPGLRPILYQSGNLSVALTRNRIVKKFLATDCTTLMMVDDDVVPPPHFIETLDAFIPEYGMVGIPHPMRNPSDPGSLGLCVLKKDKDGLLNGCALEKGMNEVDAIATGCVAISREAVEAVGENPFRIENNPDALITSDDFLFCADLQERGFKVGSWWDGYFCDHLSTTSLAPLLERSLRG